MDIYSRYGRLREAYEVTLELLRALKNGEVGLERVNVGETGWSLEEEYEYVIDDS